MSSYGVEKIGSIVQRLCREYGVHIERDPEHGLFWLHAQKDARALQEEIEESGSIDSDYQPASRNRTPPAWCRGNNNEGESIK